MTKSDTTDAPDTRDLRVRLEEYINKTDYVSFAELGTRFGEDHFSGGEHVIQLKPNLILWAGLSQEAANAIRGLLNEQLIVAQPSSLLVYMIDGAYPHLPIAKAIRSYKKDHWLPVTLRPAQKNRSRPTPSAAVRHS